MQQLRVQFNFAVIGATAEEVNDAAPAQRPGGRFPHFRNTHRLNGDVGAMTAGERADSPTASFGSPEITNSSAPIAAARSSCVLRRPNARTRAP